MIQISETVRDYFERRLARASVPKGKRPEYRKWVRYYLDFCQKYDHPPRSASSVEPFLAKLASKHQSAAKREQASRAVDLLIGNGTPDQKGQLNVNERPEARMEQKPSLKVEGGRGTNRVQLAGRGKRETHGPRGDVPDEARVPESEPRGAWRLLGE